MEEAKRIIESSTLEGRNPEGLSFYPDFNAKLESELKILEDGLDFSENLTLERRVVGAQFLVLKLTSNSLTGVHSTDLIAFDDTAGLIRRVRLLPDGRMIRMVGLLQPKQEAGLFSFFERVISWSGTVERNGKATGSRVIATESAYIPKHEGSVKGDGTLRWDQAFLNDTGVTRRESFRFHRHTPRKIQPEYPPTSQPKTGLAGMVSRIFGKKKTEPNQLSKPPEDYVFEDLNFRFKNPGVKFSRMEGPLPNESISLMLIRNLPHRSFMITAEDGGEALDLNSSNLAAIAQTNLKSIYPNVTCGEIHSKTINGLEFSIFQSHGNLTRSKECSWVHATLAHNGYFYQLIFVAPSTSAKRAEIEALKLFPNFELIDPDRKAFGATVAHAKPYHRPDFGIQADFTGMKGLLWDTSDLNLQFPSADFGTIIQMGTGIVIAPVDLRSLNPDDDALHIGLLKTMGIAHDQDVIETRNHHQGAYSGKQFKALYNERGTDYTHWVRVLRHDDKACVLSAFSTGQGPDRDEEVRSMLDAVVLNKPSPSLQENSADNDRRQATAINVLGLYFYEKNDHASAVKYFAEAFRRNPSDIVILGNQLDSLDELGRAEEAISLLEKHDEATNSNPDLIIRRSILLSRAERKEDSIATFRSFFSEGKRHDDGLLSYIVVLMELGRLEQACNEIDGYVERHEISSIRVRRWQYQTHSQAGRHDVAARLARSLHEEHPENTQLKLDLADALIEEGKGEEALRLIDELLASENSRQDPYLLLRKGKALIVTDNFKLAKETLEEAATIAPADPDIQNSLNLVSSLLGQGDHSTIKQSLSAVAAPEELEKAMADIKAGNPAPGFNSRFVHSTTGFHFERNKPLRKTEFREIAIHNFSGVAEHKTITYRFNPTYERAFVNFIEVIDKEGKKVSQGKISDYYVSEGQGGYDQIASGDKLLNAPVPGLKPGHIIRYQLTIESKASIEQFPFERILFATLSPSGPRGVFITGEVDQIGNLEHHATFTKGRGDDYLFWMLPDPPRFQFESYQPQFDKFLPSLTLGSRDTTWKKLASEYLDEIKKQLVQDTSVKELTEELIEGVDGKEARTQAILRFVQRSINYQAIEFGSRARTPNSATTTIRNRYGDCKDHSVLAQQLLKTAGIESSLALVSTGSRVHIELPSLDQFDHMILFIPGPDGGHYVDCTSKYEGFKRHSSTLLEGKQALILHPDEPHIARIQVSEPNEHTITTKRDIRIGKERTDLTVSETTSFKGAQSGWIRAQFLTIPEPDRISSLVQLLGVDSRMKIKSLKIENLDELDLPLVLHLDYTIHRSLRESGGRRSSRLPAVWENLYFKEGARGTRMTPFEITTPYQFSSTVNIIHPPESSKVAITASPIQQTHPWCAWTLKTGISEGTTRLQWSAEMKAGQHSKDSYSDFSQSLSVMLESIEATIDITD